MPFTLAISAAAPAVCAALVRAALDTDPRVMPVPGPARLAWRAPDERSALLHWGSGPAGATSATGPAGTIGPAGVIGPAGAVQARTSLTRTDPVYLAARDDAVVIGDRASWVAAATGRLTDHDPVMAAALLNLGFPLGDVTPYRGVRALGGARTAIATNGRLTVSPVIPGPSPASLADALIDTVAPLRDSVVEADLTGGKDSRLIAAALTAAKIPFRARTHGLPEHPDVITAAVVADRLGVEHVVTAPRPAAALTTDDVLARVRSAALVADGMLSAFENTGGPDPQFGSDVIHVGGHGGELLRGGYASYAAGRLAAVRGAAQFRRLTTGRLALLRPDAAAAYLAALAPWTAAFARGPRRALDDFYLVNRAGRWSAVARQAYLLREHLCQPFFADDVVLAARAVPLRDRLASCCYRNALSCLVPDLLDIPLAGRAPASVDWRRSLRPELAGFLRGYVLDQGMAVFGTVSRRAAERALRGTDPAAAWALATLAARLSGDWLNARMVDQR
jgi:Asparagine synthase